MAYQEGTVTVENLKVWIDYWVKTDKYYHPFSKGKTIPISELLDLIDRLARYESIMANNEED